MKKFLALTTFICIMGILCSCNKYGEDLDPLNSEPFPFQVTVSDGSSFSFSDIKATTVRSTFGQPEIEDGIMAMASTNGKTADSHFYFSALFYNSAIAATIPGSEIKPSAINFSKPLSSNSRDYTNAYSGKIYLIKNTESYISLSFDNVTFKLSNLTYTFDGNIIFRIAYKA